MKRLARKVLAGRTKDEKGATMPFIDIKVIEGVFTSEEQRDMVERVTDAVVAVEGEALRPFTVTVVTETPSGSWGVGGQTLTSEAVKAKRAEAAVLA